MKPLSMASLHQLKRWFWILLLANAIYMVAIHFLLQPLTSSEIVHFETARKVSVAETIIQEWKDSGKLNKAVISVYVDFLFILLYTSGLAVGSVFLARLTQHEILGRAGKLFAWLLVIAGLADIVENIALLRSLQNYVQHVNVVLAYDMAATKFSIIILTVLFMIICLIFWGLLFVEPRKGK